MTYFKLDIPKVNESVSSYKTKKNNCFEDINLVYNGLGYTESAWNDQNAYSFIEKVKKDRYNLNEFFVYLDNLYEEINTFKNNIDDICAKQGYRRNTIIFKFDDSSISLCKEYLNNAVTYLNYALNRIDINDFPDDFEYTNKLYDLRSEIKSIRNSIKNLINDIDKFVSQVNNEIYDSKNRLKRLGTSNFNLKVTDYKWGITDLNAKVNVNKSIQTYNQVNNVKTNFKVNNEDLELNETFFDLNMTKVDLKDQDSINKLNNSLNTYSTIQSDIELEENKNIKGLANNTNDYFSVQNNINLEKERKVEGLVNKVNNYAGNQTDINLEKNKELNGLTNNTTNYSSIQSNINLDEQRKVEGLTANVDVNTTNTTNIGLNNNETISGLNREVKTENLKNNEILFNSNDINSLSNNIKEANVTDNNINYAVNNVDFTNNISSFESAQTNINTSGMVNNNHNLGSGIQTAEVKTTGINSNIANNANLDININKLESLDDLNS